MEKYEEIKMIYSMLSKFQDEKTLALEDKIKLLKYVEKDPTLKDEDVYKKAWEAVEQRLQDVELSVELLQKRLYALTDDEEDED